MAQRPVRRGDPVRWWIAAPLVAAVMVLAPMPAWIVDAFYSRDLYPWIQNLATTLTNLIPVAALDVLIVGALFLVLYRVGIAAGIAWHGGVLPALSELLRRAIRGVAVVVILFVAMWGCNYRRVPLEQSISVKAPTVDTLVSAVSDANALGAVLRPGVVSSGDLDYQDLADRLRDPMNAALLQLNQEPLKRPGRPKFSLLLTPFFTWSGVNGMVDPIALESILHPDLLPSERPFVLAHEWAHLAGRADEAEANAVGWLACMNGEPVFAYSASVYLIIEAANALPSEPRRRALARLDPGVRADLEAIRRRAELQRPEVEHAATQVYDTYLRANRVADGTASYSRALTIILSPPVRDALNKYQGRTKKGE